MKAIKIVGAVLAVTLGAFIFVYGGYDDSPGAQLLGVVIAIGGIIYGVRSLKKPR